MIIIIGLMNDASNASWPSILKVMMSITDNAVNILWKYWALSENLSYVLKNPLNLLIKSIVIKKNNSKHTEAFKLIFIEPQLM